MKITINTLISFCFLAIISCKKSEKITPNTNSEIKKEGLYFYMKVNDKDVYYQDGTSNYQTFTDASSYNYDTLYMKGPNSSLIKDYCTSNGIDITFFRLYKPADFFADSFYYSFKTGEYKYSNILKGLEGASILWYDEENTQWSTNDILSYNRNNEKFIISKIELTSDPNKIIISGNFTATLGNCGGTKNVYGDFRIKIQFQKNYAGISL